MFAHQNLHLMMQVEDPKLIDNKKLNSYLGKIPSEDFCDDAYHMFLVIASPKELEEDVVSKKTIVEISKNLGSDLNKWGWDKNLYKNCETDTL